MSPNVKKSSKIKSPVVIPKKEKSGKKSATHLIPSNNKNTPSKKKKKSSLTTKKSLTKKKEIEENKNLLKVNNKSLSKLNEEIKDLFNPKSENPDIEDDSETFTDFLKKQEPKQRHFSQESSFSSVSENGKTKSFKSVKGSFSVENPEETKKMCDKMSESNPNIQCTYNEKENVCYLDMTSMVGNIVDTLGMGQKLNDDTQKVKDYLNKMLSSTMIQPRVVPSSSGYSGSPQRMMSPSEHFSPVKKMSPRVFIIQGHLPRPPMSQYQPQRNPHPFMMFGGDSCSIGKQNNCPDNGRLIYDTQGKIDCGNMSNQGGQQFMYPKKITNFVGGHKKSLKRRTQKRGGTLQVDREKIRVVESLIHDEGERVNLIDLINDREREINRVSESYKPGRFQAINNLLGRLITYLENIIDKETHIYDDDEEYLEIKQSLADILENVGIP